MKVQKKVSIQGEFAKVKEDINEGDIIGILNEGKKVAGNYGERDVFSVQTKNGPRNLTFNQTSMNYLIDVFGDETAEWVNKSIKVWINRENVSGKMRNVVYLTHPDWIEGDDGFYPPTKNGNNNEAPPLEDKDIPVIED